MKNFRSYELALGLYRECQKIKVRKAEIRDQFERASLSIVLNLAEGSGKLTAKDRRRFYSIAMGSLRETQALLMIIQEEKTAELADKLGASLFRLIQNLCNLRHHLRLLPETSFTKNRGPRFLLAPVKSWTHFV